MSLFISIEGTDGAGKTTQLNLLKEIAAQEGWILTRNPGGTRFGEKLREILLNDKSVQLHQIAELLLYMADRAQHFAEVVEPALKAGKVIICDRFIDSTVAYQGYGRGLNVQLIDQLNSLVTHDIKPHLTILLDVDPAKGLGRAKSADKMEAEGVKFQTKIRAGFLALAEAEPERFRVIDSGNSSIQEVHEAILNTIRASLKV